VLVKRVGASAPGKALLCGEYAVLEGAPAIVAAVDRRVRVSWTDDAAAMPEVEATLALAKARCGQVHGSLEVDTSALRRGTHKLGLGSSAAAAAATAGAVFATYGGRLEDPEVAQRVLDCALEGHASIAPQGSGVDVAASSFGGFLRFERDLAVEVERIAAPSELCIELIWTGHAARTSELVAKVFELRRRAPEQYQQRMARLSGVASDFAEAFERGSATDVIRAAGAYGAAMAELGEAADAPIVDARLERARALADRFSGSAKPCGAGGGDVAIAFFVDSDRAQAFKLACEDEGLHPIEVSWGAPGVRAT
jgi:phosphomevalonate kinase